MDDNNWHLVSVSYGGKVSILRNLTKDMAIKTRDILLPRFHGDSFYNISDGMIKDIYILGPENESY